MALLAAKLSATPEEPAAEPDNGGAALAGSAETIQQHEAKGFVRWNSDK